MSSWRVLLVVAAMALVAYWVWQSHAKKRPPVLVLPNTPAPTDPMPGVPPNLIAKLARVADTQIPVVMTSGTPVPHGEDEIRQIVRQALARLNALDERVSLIQVTSAAKTVDSYKTVAYDIVISVHDGRENVGVLLSLAVLVPVSGKLYIRSFRMFNSPSDRDPGPPGAGSDLSGAHAPFEDAVSVLRGMKP